MSALVATSHDNSVSTEQSLIGDATDRNTQLDLILALTDKMLELAQVEQWESVSKLEEERSRLIYTFFEVSPSVDEAEAVAEVIMKVLAVDKRLIAMSQVEQQQIIKASQTIKRGQQASKAYASSGK